jgi:hypothetical protein
MSRILAISAVFAVLAAPAAAKPSGKAQPVSWAQPQIKVVVAHGLMAKSIQSFRPNDPLTRGALNALVSGLVPEAPATSSVQAAAPVTIAQLDATMVRALASVLPPIDVVAGDRFSSDPAETNPLSPDGPFAADAAVETRPVRLVELPVGATVELKPGGYHIMFMGLKAPFAKDASIPVTLVFEKAGSIDVEMKVEAMGSAAPAHRH